MTDGRTRQGVIKHLTCVGTASAEGVKWILGQRDLRLTSSRPNQATTSFRSLLGRVAAPPSINLTFCFVWGEATRDEEEGDKWEMRGDCICNYIA